MVVLHFVVSALFVYPVLSLMEYIIHRHLMHRNTLARLLHNSYLASTFRDHAIIHHARCYALFDREKGICAEINIRIKPFTSLTVMALPSLAILLLDPITSVVFFAGGIANAALWSEIHDEMHRPMGAWFSNLRAYQHLKRRHYLHHRHPNTNFNTLFPMWDWVLGTTAVETDDDRLAMQSATWRVRSASHDGISQSV